MADDDVIQLTSANGEVIDFIEIAGIAYGGKFYAILQPVELLQGMDDDEALVFRVTRGSNGEDNFEIELDDDIVDAVFKEYNRLLDEELKKNNTNSSKKSNSNSRNSGKKKDKDKDKDQDGKPKPFAIIITLVLAIVAFSLTSVHWLFLIAGGLLALSFLGSLARYAFWLVKNKPKKK